MSNSPDQLVETLQRLQVTANCCASSFTTSQLKVEYRVASSAGAALPWRLMEIHRAVKEPGEPRLLRRMLCFRNADTLEHSIQERTTWKAQDQALVKSHLVRVRALTPPEAPKADLQALTATRQALRAKMCSTRPDRVVDLPKR